VDTVFRSKKQNNEQGFEVGVLGQVKQCRDEEREGQGGIWEVNLGYIWKLFYILFCAGRPKFFCN